MTIAGTQRDDAVHRETQRLNGNLRNNVPAAWGIVYPHPAHSRRIRCINTHAGQYASPHKEDGDVVAPVRCRIRPVSRWNPQRQARSRIHTMPITEATADAGNQALAAV